MEQKQLEQLSSLIDKFSNEEGFHKTSIPGVNCIRMSEANVRLPSAYMPCMCVVLRGKKQVYLEADTFQYQPSQFLVVSVDLPVIGEVTEASPEQPYLCFQIELDASEIAELLTQVATPAPKETSNRRGIFVGELDHALYDCLLRMAQLLQTPQDIPTLAPMIKREIYYRLLNSTYGDDIVPFFRHGSQMQRIAVAIRELKANFDKPIHIESLANRVGMSISSFHAHFKSVTAMSPLQFQKYLRLMEARQIMLEERRDAASTAYRVGYESPSQFNREYARLFGNPPGRDIRRLMATQA